MFLLTAFCIAVKGTVVPRSSDTLVASAAAGAGLGAAAGCAGAGAEGAGADGADGAGAAAIGTVRGEVEIGGVRDHAGALALLTSSASGEFKVPAHRISQGLAALVLFAHAEPHHAWTVAAFHPIHPPQALCAAKSDCQNHMQSKTAVNRPEGALEPFLAASTSEAVMRPAGPVPPMAARSTPSSFASFFAYGVATMRPSARFCGAGAAAGGGAGGSAAASIAAATGCT